jgi:hypothetical protein
MISASGQQGSELERTIGKRAGGGGERKKVGTIFEKNGDQDKKYYFSFHLQWKGLEPVTSSLPLGVNFVPQG